MPYRKGSDGKWLKTLGRSGNAVGPAERLMIIDKQVDSEGSLQKSVLPTVMTLSFDSKVHKVDQLVDMVRTAHQSNGQPFKSIAFANHGPNAKGDWVWAKGTSVDMTEKGVDDLQLAKDAARTIAPALEVMIAALEKTKMNVAHIELLACKLAGVNSAFVPYLERLYHVDFRASDNDTGNGAQQGDWKMETDDYDFAKDYLDLKLVEQYKETMNPVLAFVGKQVAGAVIGNVIGGIF